MKKFSKRHLQKNFSDAVMKDLFDKLSNDLYSILRDSNMSLYHNDRRAQEFVLLLYPDEKPELERLNPVDPKRFFSKEFIDVFSLNAVYLIKRRNEILKCYLPHSKLISKTLYGGGNEPFFLDLAYKSGISVPRLIKYSQEYDMLVEEKVNGERFPKAIRGYFKINEDRAFEIIKKVGIELGKIHSLKIRHGDFFFHVKNILINLDELRVWFVDFEFAKYANEYERGMELGWTIHNLCSCLPKKHRSDSINSFLRGYREKNPNNINVVPHFRHVMRREGNYRGN